MGSVVRDHTFFSHCAIVAKAFVMQSAGNLVWRIHGYGNLRSPAEKSFFTAGKAANNNINDGLISVSFPKFRMMTSLYT